MTVSEILDDFLGLFYVRRYELKDFFSVLISCFWSPSIEETREL